MAGRTGVIPQIYHPSTQEAETGWGWWWQLGRSLYFTVTSLALTLCEPKTSRKRGLPVLLIPQGWVIWELAYHKFGVKLSLLPPTSDLIALWCATWNLECKNVMDCWLLTSQGNHVISWHLKDVFIFAVTQLLAISTNISEARLKTFFCSVTIKSSWTLTTLEHAVWDKMAHVPGPW